MPSLLLFFSLAVGLGGLAWFVRDSLIRRQVRRRLQAPLAGDVEHVEAAIARPAPPAAASIFRRYRAVPWVLAVVVGLACYYLVGIKPIFCISIAAMVGLLGGQVEAYLVERKKAMVEQQLADSLDLMISTLRAGASLVASMERAAEEVRAPMKGELYNVLRLIRFGDDPRAVMRRLMQRIPLESFRLLAMTFTVHFDVGGSLAPTLAVVGRIVRDRIEISRRVRSLTTQTRVSTIALIVVTYGIAFVMWRNDPNGMRMFVTSVIGSALVAGTMILHAIGIVWQSSMSKIRV